jgi:hypothetical protein
LAEQVLWSTLQQNVYGPYTTSLLPWLYNSGTVVLVVVVAAYVVVVVVV